MPTLKDIWQEIVQAQTIVLFRHVHPDNDAIGSVLGMQKGLKALFPEKTVLTAGLEAKDGITSDHPEDEVIAQSLAILMDTSNGARIDDQRYFKAAKTIRLDHHVKVEDLADLDFVDDKASAASEIAARLFQENGQTISKEAAQHLYEGLTCDNINFTTSNTTPASLKAGAWLLEQGADPVAANERLKSRPLAQFEYETAIRKQAVWKNGFLYAVMSKMDYIRLGLTCDEAREKVHVLADVADAPIWALFTETEDGTFAASLRSRTQDVRTIAARYGGGGHVCAAGIKGLSSTQILEIIEAVSARL